MALNASKYMWQKQLPSVQIQSFWHFHYPELDPHKRYDWLNVLNWIAQKFGSFQFECQSKIFTINLNSFIHSLEMEMTVHRCTHHCTQSNTFKKRDVIDKMASMGIKVTFTSIASFWSDFIFDTHTDAQSHSMNGTVCV